MQLKEMQQVLIQGTHGAPSALEAVKQLKAAVERSLDHLQEGHMVQAQVFLESGLTYLMSAFHYLNIDLEKVVEREQRRRENEEQTRQDRVILVFSDHAELRVSGELRGTIPLYSADDYQELRQIAHLFQCRLEHADHIQLDLFSLLQAAKTPPSASAEGCG